MTRKTHGILCKLFQKSLWLQLWILSKISS